MNGLIPSSQLSLDVAQTKDPDKLIEYDTMASAISRLLKQSGESLESQNEYAKVGIEAEWFLGEVVEEMPNAKTGPKQELGSTREPNSNVPTLAERGITKKRSYRSRLTHSIPWEVLQAFMATATTAEQELTRASVHRLAKHLRRQTNQRIYEHNAHIKPPTLYVARAEAMQLVASDSVDIVVTSPPYNLGDDNWPMGGNGRTTRDGIEYAAHGDDMPQVQYEDWQFEVFREMYRVARPGASFFYNHKVRTTEGRMIHPMQWLLSPENPWTLRQEIIWDRKSTHNHSSRLFWPIDERIYWMTKGKPVIRSEAIGTPTIWTEFGPIANTWHPAPFTDKLPRMLLQAIGVDSETVVLDPFAGSCTTVRVALEMGCSAIGVDISRHYLEQACLENGWSNGTIH